MTKERTRTPIYLDLVVSCKTCGCLMLIRNATPGPPFQFIADLFGRYPFWGPSPTGDKWEPSYYCGRCFKSEKESKNATD